MTGTRLATALIAFAAVVLPLAAVLLYQPDLQFIATSACRCEHIATDAKGKASCWRAFEKAAGPIDPNAGLSSGACLIAQESQCYLRGGCVVKRYAIVTVPEAMFCTADEAREAASLEYTLEAQQDWRVFQQRVRELSRRYADGDRAETGREGCI